jgi:hypothetical protein
MVNANTYGTIHDGIEPKTLTILRSCTDAMEAVFRIRIDVIAYSDPAFYLYAYPDPGGQPNPEKLDPVQTFPSHKVDFDIQNIGTFCM